MNTVSRCTGKHADHYFAVFVYHRFLALLTLVNSIVIKNFQLVVLYINHRLAEVALHAAASLSESMAHKLLVQYVTLLKCSLLPLSH